MVPGEVCWCGSASFLLCQMPDLMRCAWVGVDRRESKEADARCPRCGYEQTRQRRLTQGAREERGI